MNVQKINAINAVIEKYFTLYPNANRIAAKDMMNHFIKEGIFKKDHRNGLPIRNILRDLDAKGELNKIPHVLAERKGVNTNWYFLRPRAGSLSQAIYEVSAKPCPPVSKVSQFKRNSKSDKDEHYVIDLCDAILKQKASRQHRFIFLRGDSRNGKPGIKLPVDSYYEQLKLVIEFREKQHTEKANLFDKPDIMTVSGVNRGEQRKIYDQRRRDILPLNGIKLVEISYSDFEFNKQKKIKRNTQKDMEIVKNILFDNKVIDKK